MELIWMSEKPSEYSFDEIEIGMQKNFKVNISENMLNEFGVTQKIIIHYI